MTNLYTRVSFRQFGVGNNFITDFISSTFPPEFLKHETILPSRRKIPNTFIHTCEKLTYSRNSCSFPSTREALKISENSIYNFFFIWRKKRYVIAKNTSNFCKIHEKFENILSISNISA